MEKPIAKDSLARLREKIEKNPEDLPAHDDPGEMWDEYTDENGRVFMRSKFDYRARAWAKICLDFGYTLELHPQESLSEVDKKIRDTLALGRVNAMLYGPPGTGKTTIALLALRELFFAGRTVSACRFTTLKTQMEPRYCDVHNVSPEDVLARYHAPDFLLIDELGYGEYRKATTEHERRVLFDVISPRHGVGKKTWLLSNIVRDDLYELYGEATFSRIDEVGRCVTADFTGRPNYRLEVPK